MNVGLNVSRIRLRLVGGALVGGALLGTLGCVDYTIETTLRPDGSGVRVERIEATRNQDVPIALADFRALTFTTEARGWTANTEVDEHGDTTWVLQRETHVKDLADWSEPKVGVRIAGVVPAKAGTRIGYVELGDVLFHNSIQVSAGRRSDGSASFSYREAFLWDSATDAIVEYILGDLDRTLRTRYPHLTDSERGAIVGFARARIWVAVDEGLLADDSEEALSGAVDSTAEQAAKIIRVRYRDADEEALRSSLSELFVMSDERGERLLRETLPGLNVALNTEFEFRLTLPGHVTLSNADRQDGDTLIWEFGPLDALSAPVELFAESELGG